MCKGLQESEVLAYSSVLRWDSLGGGRVSWWTWYAMLIIRIFTTGNRKTMKNFKKGVIRVHSKEKGRS